MNWEALGAIGEIVGAVAVIATLGYLAVQMRQNTIQMRESVKVTHLDSLHQTIDSFSRYRHLLSQPEAADVYVRGLDGYSALDPADQVRFRAIIEEYFFAYAAMFQRLTEGLYEHSLWIQQARSAASLLLTPGGRDWWEHRKSMFEAEFVSEFERLAEGADSPAAVQAAESTHP